MNRKYKIEFLGCKTNQADALSIAGLLQRAGWAEAGQGNNADLVIIQSCTVTMSADAQGRQLARKMKRQNPDAAILLTGCYAQRAENELLSIPEIDHVIGNLNPRKFELLSKIAGADVQTDHPDFPMPVESARTRQYIKIQDGCDARCSYCIIPEVRGKSRSLPPQEVLRRIAYYRDAGYREMILTGISLGGYGKDLNPRTSLAELMTSIACMSGDFKIRISSLEPEEIHQDFIDAFTFSDRFQPHLHLPLQSASDHVLKKMRRQYLFRHFDSIVNRLFSRMPHLNLGTDLLTGFPDEDDNSFLETRKYLNDAPFAYAHVFPYSPRPGTPAAGYEPSASRQKVHDRSEDLRRIAQKKNISYRQRFLGQPLKALMLQGTEDALTDNYIKVRLSNSHSANGVLSVRIDAVSEESTLGSVVNV